MTDTTTNDVVMPTLPVPIELVEDETFPCPKCGKVFHSSNQLGGHLSSAHRDKPRKVPCPECGAQYQRGVGLASHRSRVHGVLGTSKSVRARNAARERKEAIKAEKVETHDWDADDIFEVVVATMWPNGTIPVSAVMPLIRWRESTHDLIITLRGQES